MMHPAAHGGFPAAGFYRDGQVHGHYRSPNFPPPSHGSSFQVPLLIELCQLILSSLVSPYNFQNLTSHWNISAPPPYPGHAPQVPPMNTGSSSGGGGSKKHQLGQIGSVQQPKPPDKPLLPYMRYSRKMWEQLKAEGKRVWEVGKIIGQKWREIPDEEKQPFLDEYEREKVIYNEQMKAYRNSPAYKRWIEAKQQADQAAREAATLGTQPNEYGPPPPPVIAPPRQTPAEARLQMMQQEDEEDEYITMKQVAAVRFHRNHRLMAEIFNDVVIPDTRTVVREQRLVVLKSQVRSLLQHQKKLEEELHHINSRFEEKKRKFLEDSEKFRRELKKLHDNPPTSWKKPLVQLSVKDLPPPLEKPKFKKL